MGSNTAPWEAAHAAADRAGISIRPLTRPDDVEGVVAIIAAVWGPEAMPPALVRAFQHAGASLYGAEAANDLSGFVLGFLGLEGGLHLHSHMLAVLPGQQSRGIGYALKLAQRAGALESGVEEIRWTFDPLIARNARFNLNRLGTVATAYFPGFYGHMPDKVNAGDRSDRFEVRWRLRSHRVEDAVNGREVVRPAVIYPSVLDAEGPPDSPQPKESGQVAAGPVTVQIPRDYQALRARDPELGARWREAAGRAFAACFERGLQAEFILDDRYWFSPAVFRL